MEEAEVEWGDKGTASSVRQVEFEVSKVFQDILDSAVGNRVWRSRVLVARVAGYEWLKPIMGIVDFKEGRRKRRGRRRGLRKRSWRHPGKGFWRGRRRETKALGIKPEPVTHRSWRV